MKKILGSGFIYANVVEDEFEGNTYYKLEVLVNEKRNMYESVKLKAPASYSVILDQFEQQAKADKQ